MAIAGLDETTTNFAVHPDFRQVAAFALGWVFVTSLSCIISSVLIQRLFGLIRGRSSGSQDLEHSYVSEKLSIHSLDIENKLDLRHGYSNTALFALPLCFLFASVAQFASLLAFPLSGDATCAFVVAWGGMAAQSGRLVGALVVIFELRKMGIARWEFWVAIVWLIIGIAFIFLNNAVSVGVLTTFKPLGVAYCDRKHFLPASLVSSILYFSLEVYAIARMMLLLSSNAQMRQIIRDNRVVRPVALIFLELLTLVPSAVFTNTVAEFVPFSVGAVAVLLAFSYRPPPRLEPLSPRMSTLSYVTYPSVQNITVQTTRPSVTSSRPASTRPPSPPAASAPVRHHPYSASALSEHRLETDGWNPATARSTRTIDTAAAQSIHNAVVQVGQRARAASHNEAAPQFTKMIVPSQVAYAERLDLDYAAASSLPTPTALRTTIQIPTTEDDDEDISELISPASRMPASNFRLSRLGERRNTFRTSFRTSYRTSFIPETVPSSPESEVSSHRDMPIPLHDSRSISSSSSERRRSASVSGTQECGSVDHRRTISVPGATAVRWPTFNGEQFRAAGYGRTRSRASSNASPPTIHRPPPLSLPNQPPPLSMLPAAGPGIRATLTPRGPRPPPQSAQSLRFNLMASSPPS
ncbi:hypothetical protein DFH08DRAFT_831157 [Mycena albidolilacea]|uniref:Uncharacterized protein n=1 Tax=Mycena albidolilacea TaxID=1033008 RepID=A0AAD7AUI1_9AGAR|nr:hypothetical protein DFH08DRAFT_831157 [Mycena albidolilacea]